MSCSLRIRLLLAVVATAVLSSSSFAGVITNVRSVKLTNNGDSFLFINELDFFAGGVDAASVANGATITATDPAVRWGTDEGAIDDFVQTGGCCDGTYHSDTGDGGQSVNITFDQSYDIDSADFYGRLDGCCAERGDDFTVELFSDVDATGNLLYSTQVLGAGTDSLADFQAGGTGAIAIAIPEPSTLVLAGIAVALLGAFVRRRRIA